MVLAINKCCEKASKLGYAGICLGECPFNPCLEDVVYNGENKARAKRQVIEYRLLHGEKVEDLKREYNLTQEFMQSIKVGEVN